MCGSATNRYLMETDDLMGLYHTLFLANHLILSSRRHIAAQSDFFVQFESCTHTSISRYMRHSTGYICCFIDDNCPKLTVTAVFYSDLYFLLYF